MLRATKLAGLSTSLTVRVPPVLWAASVSVRLALDVPPIAAGSFTAVMLTVVEPNALSALPTPWLPVLPSLKVQLICTLAGGVSEALA